MKAIVQTRYGPPSVMQLTEIDKPVPRDNDILIKVKAASVNAFDWHILMADPWLVRLMGMGFFKPKIHILGADIAGVVETVGAEVTKFKPGDEVFGDLASKGCGGFAEYATALENSIVPKPSKLSFEEAAAIPMAAVTALQGLRDHGNIRAGQKVLINGASGGVGTYAVQLAKAFDTEVTAVCSTRNVEQAGALGADHVIDYTKEDFSEGENKYDLILSAFGNRSMAAYKRALKEGGTFVLTGGSMSQMYRFLLAKPFLRKSSGKKFEGYVASINAEDLQYLAGLVEAGKLRPVIDRRYTLEEVPQAVEYVHDGHARGKVVINVSG